MYGHLFDSDNRWQNCWHIVLKYGNYREQKNPHHSPPPRHSNLGCLLFSIGSLNSGTTFHGKDRGRKASFSPLEVSKTFWKPLNNKVSQLILSLIDSLIWIEIRITIHTCILKKILVKMVNIPDFIHFRFRSRDIPVVRWLKAPIYTERTKAPNFAWL